MNRIPLVKTGTAVNEFSLETNHHDYDSSLSVLRRPNQQFKWRSEFEVSESLWLSGLWRYVGRSFDQDFTTFPATTVELAAYDVLNISISKREEAYELSFGADNVFNRQYEAVRNYSVMPLNFFSRASIRF